MTDPTVTLRGADADDLDRVEQLLDASGLPSADVRAKPESFFVACSGGERVGVGGVERYGSNGLLRSVVVEASRRGQGYGRALCEALEAHSRADGVETLYLLTTTARDFFERLGYEPVPREAAAPRIRETTEFTDLCPDSAVCMRTELDG